MEGFPRLEALQLEGQWACSRVYAGHSGCGASLLAALEGSGIAHGLRSLTLIGLDHEDFPMDAFAACLGRDVLANLEHLIFKPNLFGSWSSVPLVVRELMEDRCPLLRHLELIGGSVTSDQSLQLLAAAMLASPVGDRLEAALTLRLGGHRQTYCRTYSMLVTVLQQPDAIVPTAAWNIGVLGGDVSPLTGLRDALTSGALPALQHLYICDGAFWGNGVPGSAAEGIRGVSATRGTALRVYWCP